jgi:hypothetical protein
MCMLGATVILSPATQAIANLWKRRRWSDRPLLMRLVALRRLGAVSDRGKSAEDFVGSDP